jgi:hypothetical protein
LRSNQKPGPVSKSRLFDWRLGGYSRGCLQSRLVERHGRADLVIDADRISFDILCRVNKNTATVLIIKTVAGAGVGLRREDVDNQRRDFSPPAGASGQYTVLVGTLF